MQTSSATQTHRHLDTHTHMQSHFHVSHLNQWMKKEKICVGNSLLNDVEENTLPSVIVVWFEGNKSHIRIKQDNQFVCRATQRNLVCDEKYAPNNCM